MSKSFKNISIVATTTVLSRCLGLGRDMLVTAVFGTSALSSAFVTAFSLPNLFRRLLGEGALTAAFVPTLNDEIERREHAGAFALVSKVTSWLTLVTLVVVGLAMLALAHVGPLLDWAQRHGAEAETVRRFRDAAQLGVILFPYLIFVCLAAAFSAVLQVLSHFIEPALSGIWLNLSMIAALGGGGWLWAHTPEGKMQWLCAGVLTGGFLQLAVPMGSLYLRGWRPRFDLKPSASVIEIVKLMGPTVIGTAIYLINMFVSRFIGLSLNDAAATILNLSTRIMELPIGVFTVAVSTVVFPLIAKYASRREFGRLGEAYRKGMRLILVLNVPAAAGIVLLSHPIVRLLFQRGAFHASDTRLTVPVLAVYALGLPFFSFVSLAIRAFYAQKDTATPVRAAAISFVLNLGLSLALMGPLSIVGLALASNIAIVAQAWYLQVHLSRKLPQLGFRPLLGSLGKILLATAAMGAVVWFGSRGVAHVIHRARLADLAALGLLIPLGAAVYGGALWLLKIEGREDLAAVAKKFRGKFA